MRGNVDIAAFASALKCFVVASGALHAHVALIAFDAFVFGQA